MFRKRRQPAPNFRMPGAPFNPVTGQRAQMNPEPTPGTILATFQVIGNDPDDAATQDTHANYVVCRGYEPQTDPFFRYLHDPYTKPDTTPINVAKPYAIRGTYPYKQGQVIVAARILTRLGVNQGKAVTTVGHPADLDEETELLLDDDDVAIAWLDISVSSPPARVGKTTASHAKGASQTVNRWRADTQAVTSPLVTDSVLNLFADVESAKWCAYINIDGVNCMIAAECE